MNHIKFLSFFSILFFYSLSSYCQAYEIRSYDVDINIQINGDIDVHEIISVDFHEKRRGIMREIPKSIEVNNEIQKVKLKNVSVAGFDYKKLSKGNNNTIRIGDPDIYLTGIKTYDIKYTLQNVMLKEQDHTAFQYNIIADWDTSIDTVNYSITLPKELDISYRDYRVFTGRDNANERGANILMEGNRIYGHSYQKLNAEENITVAVKFPIDYFVLPLPPPPLFQRDKSWFAPVGLFILILAYFKRFRERYQTLPINNIHYPPKNMSPAELGTFIDGKANTRDLIALLPYWANEKYIEIIGDDNPSEDYVLFFKKLKNLDPDLPQYQHTLFEGVFKGEDMIALPELKEKIYKVTAQASKQIKEFLIEKNLYDAEEKSKFHSGKMFIYSLLAILTGIFIIVKTGWIITGIGFFALAILAIVLFFIPVNKSEKGFILHDEVKALKNFLENGTGDELNRILKSDSSYFDKLYPYSIAFGIDQAWMNRMQDYDIKSPHWYYYGPGNTISNRPLSDFSQNFNVAKISSVFTSTPPPPPSSGGSGGFSGGGSSGGGFGGGGSSW